MAREIDPRDCQDGFADTDQALRDAAPQLLDALVEVVRVFDSNPSSIVDTVWVTGGKPETLYERCQAAIAQATGREA